MTNPSQTKDDAKAARELRIREKAYLLWEADGSPAGEAEYYWNLARKYVDAEDARPGENPASATKSSDD
jgi:hypothetical protein